MLYVTGKVTRAQVIARFNLVGQEQTDLDAIKTKYDALPSDISKITYIWTIESAGMFYQDGTITSVQYLNFLGF
jgi:stress response protein SCP2